ncbi:hypothetical protein OESDEN_10578 [Oesophagostomum dentatum]|uniref:Uncharacterized protein n=1 Tax=Oesophagostomum dentatum TaxID=61180 RepID=A0A0B1SXB3_OESDE|nr:hypothetical protein OESDEN_10578 [Oesophagostomum dentatum]
MFPKGGGQPHWGTVYFDQHVKVEGTFIQDEGYEFLGEADIDSRTMQYVFQGHVHIVDKASFALIISLPERSGYQQPIHILRGLLSIDPVIVSSLIQLKKNLFQNGRILNLTQSPMQQERIRLLQYVGTPESNNFKFVWVIARNLDVSNAISIREQGNLCSPRLAPAVFQDEGYEFLGEADIDSRTMQYVFQGHVHIVDKASFALTISSLDV